MKAAWTPQPGPQVKAILASWCPELFYGGAAGGGKSDFLLGDFLQDVNNYGEHWKGILFRRTNDELEELLQRSFELYPQIGAEWQAVKRTWLFPSGATLKLRYLERPQDYFRYHGHQYAWIGWDELPSWPTPEAYLKMFSRLRSAHDIPRKRIRATGNPAGVGHAWIKSRFIDPLPRGFYPIADETTGIERMYIPSRVWDNKILLRNDPSYIDNLKMSGPPALVDAWLNGDWSTVVGAYFTEFDSEKHIIKPFTIPRYWTTFGAFDWGSAAPFAFVWCAVSPGEQPEGSDRYIPKDAIVVFNEWYGASEPGVGLKLHAEDVAGGIRERTSTDLNYRVADPAIFAQDGGPSLAETFVRNGVRFRPADNARIPGWNQLRSRLIGMDDKPMIYFTWNCVNCIRTVPAMQHDYRNPEDCDTSGDDHCADAVRYAVMSRPWSAPKPKAEPTRGIDQVNLNQLWKTKKQKRAKRI